MAKSPRKNASDGKLYPEYPLTPRKSGRWRKIHKGKSHWFGPLDAPDGALAYFNHAWPHIRQGKRIPPMPGEKSEAQQGDDVNRLDDTLDAFLGSRAEKVRGGELSERMLSDYASTARLILEGIDGWRDVDDLTADDFDANQVPHELYRAMLRRIVPLPPSRYGRGRHDRYHLNNLSEYFTGRGIGADAL